MEVQQLQFSILSPEEIEKGSVVEVDNTNLVGDEKGLFDPRMGPIDDTTLCRTCGWTYLKCPGHFSHINLAVPVFHVGFIKTVKAILKIICINCAQVPKFPQHILDIKENDKRLKAMEDFSGNVGHCDKCDAIKSTVKLKPTTEIILELKNGGQPHSPTAEEILNIFKRISDEDIEKMGFSPEFSRPEWMIMTKLSVPPSVIRPTVVIDSSKGFDDLTYKLVDLVKSNTELKKQIQLGHAAHVIRELTMLLQHHVTTWINNTISNEPTATQRSGRRELKTLTTRLKGKGGRLRGNLMGKRVNFTARTVITPDPTIAVDELGVPVEIAQTLTYPEKVTQFNRAKLLGLIKNGPYVYPGAKNIVKSHRRLDLRFAKYKVELKESELLKGTFSERLVNTAGEDLLEDGDIIERTLMDGDLVIFNRQPSLHKMSMMGHRVKVMPGKTFRLNLAATKPYNADQQPSRFATGRC